MPDITHRRRAAERVVLIGHAGHVGHQQRGRPHRHRRARRSPSCPTRSSRSARCARRVADIEIREQATIGGNLCAPPGVESPRGDLQAALLALDAQVRSAGAGGERTEPVEDFLAAGRRTARARHLLRRARGRRRPRRVRRPHAHAYTVMRVCAARVGGEVRIAVSGAGPHAVRLRAAEAALAGGADAAAAAQRALEDVTPADDALASGWYRAKMLPVLVRDALDPARLRSTMRTHGQRGASTTCSRPRSPRCWTCCARSSTSRARRRAASRAAAAPAPSSSTASRAARACCRSPRSRAPRSRRSRACRTGEELSTVQAAFHEHYAAQCGFCTSGFVMAAAGARRAGGEHVRARTIIEALSGHVCRCTGYVKIIDAVAAAVARRRPSPRSLGRRPAAGEDDAR